MERERERDKEAHIQTNNYIERITDWQTDHTVRKTLSWF